MHFESGVGHIGGNLSALDILLVLYHDVMAPDDQFVLSKGHAAGALYITLWSLGRLDRRGTAAVSTRTARGCSGHPPARGIPRHPFRHRQPRARAVAGRGPGAGQAASSGEPGHVFCLTSDGEWNEGSSWEALIFAAASAAWNLTLIVDLNGLRVLARRTRSRISIRWPISSARSACRPLEIDGHDSDGASATRCATSRRHGPGRIVVAETRKGCGVSFMEDRMEWHYLPLTAAQYRAGRRRKSEQPCAMSSASLS